VVEAVGEEVVQEVLEVLVVQEVLAVISPLSVLRSLFLGR
jgi:hypothetical protein